MSYIKTALELKKELDKLKPLSADEEGRIMQKLRLDWNYHSNSLEGNSLTYGETVNLILNDKTADNKSFKDNGEIRVHNQAIKYVEESVKNQTPLTEYFIRGLHQLILKEPYETDAITVDGQRTKKKVVLGRYKAQPNHVKTPTGEMFYFARPEETAFKMEELMIWFRQEESRPDVNPIILAAVFHHKFIIIHPFDDGNGRLVRLLMNFILMQFGFPPAIIKTQDRSNYISALTKANAGEIEIFVEYVAKNVVNSLELMIKVAKGEDIEELDDLDKKIALLEQKLKSKNSQIEVIKSKEAILDIFDNSFVKLCEKLIVGRKKFDRFYKNNEVAFSYQIKGKTPCYHKNIDQIRQNINEDIKNISFHYFSSFLDCNLDNSEKFSFKIHIDFDFSNSSFSIKRERRFADKSGQVKVFSEPEIKKVYGKNFTKEEIEDFVKKEGEIHLEMMEKLTN